MINRLNYVTQKVCWSSGLEKLYKCFYSKVEYFQIEFHQSPSRLWLFLSPLTSVTGKNAHRKENQLARGKEMSNTTVSQESQRMLWSPKSKHKSRRIISYAKTMILYFQPLEILLNKCICLNTHRLWSFVVMAALNY